jgi:hypothetical protein
MISIIENKANPSQIDKVLGFESYKRLPGSTMSVVPFRFSNGLYRHGVPKDHVERGLIEEGLLNGESLDSPSGVTFLSRHIVRIKSDGMALDDNNPLDLLNKWILLATPDYIAKSKADLDGYVNSQRPFVLVQEGEEAKAEFNIAKMYNTAIGKLAALEESRPLYMIAIAKFLGTIHQGINSSDKAYIFLNDFINGVHHNGKKREAIRVFDAALSMSPDELAAKVDIMEAFAYNIIIRNNGVLINKLSKTVYGKTEDGVIDFLLADANQDELGNVDGTGRTYSIRNQLSKLKNK